MPSLPLLPATPSRGRFEPNAAAPVALPAAPVALPAAPVAGGSDVCFAVKTTSAVCRGEIQLAQLPSSGAYAYLDVVYVNRSEHDGDMVYRVADFEIAGRVLKNRRSHSLAIPLAALRKELCVRFVSDTPLEIEAATVRKDYYDYFGLRSQSAAPAAMAKALDRSRRAAAAIPRSVQWFVTWKCNFACAYCWQEVSADLYRAGRANRIPPEAWAARLQRLEPRELFLTGGEPTLYRQLPEFIGMLAPEIELVMHTNFGRSFSIDRWLEHVAPARFRELTLSLHPTQIEPAEFFAKLERLLAAGHRGLMVEMVLYPQNLPVAREALDRCRGLGVPLRFDPYVPAAHDPVGRDAALIAEMRNWVDEVAAYSKELGAGSSWNYDRPQFWESDEQPPVGRAPIFCPAGMRRVNVDELGDAYVCMSAIDRGKLFDRLALPHYAPIGNIFAQEFELLEAPILCWESFRCSSCDFQSLDSAWTLAPGAETPPLPE